MTVDDLINEQAQLEEQRSNMDSLRDSVARLVYPEAGEFLGQRTKGEDVNSVIFEQTAMQSLPKFVSAMKAFMMPTRTQWHELTPENGDIGDLTHESVKWLDDTAKQLHAIRNNPKSNFSSAATMAGENVGAFGCMVMYTDITPDGVLSYTSCHLKEVTFCLDETDRPYKVYRKFKMPVSKAMTQFPNVPDKWARMALTDDVDILHAVYKNDGEGRPYTGVYLCVDTKTVLDEGGYYTMPYHIGRYIVMHNEPFGRGPGTQCINEVRMLQQIRRSGIRIAHKMADPPLLVHNHGAFGLGNRRINTLPGGVVNGGVSAEGKQLVIPMQTGSDPNLLEFMLNDARYVVKDAFLVNLFQILIQSPEMTATEVLVKVEERGQLVAPYFGRLQSEWVAPMVMRELDIALRAGLIEPPPDELRATGIMVKFDAPLNRMQQVPEVISTQQVLSVLAPVAEIEPSMMDNFDMDAMTRGVSLAGGMPPSFLQAKAKVAKVRETRNQQQQQQMQVEQGTQVASAAKDAASAVQTLGGVPGG